MKPSILLSLLFLTLHETRLHAQFTCAVTKPLSETKFISAFRNAYKAVYNGATNNHNLKKEAERVFSKAAFEKVDNRGDNCLQRYEYTSQLCRACVRQLGWRAKSDFFAGRRGEERQRDFTGQLRGKMCEKKEPCKRLPKASVSPMPVGPYTRVYSSDDEKSAVVRYRFGLVAEEGSTRLVYAVTDISGRTEFQGFHGTFVEFMVDEIDVGFFECADGMLARAGLGDLAAEAVRESCYVEGEEMFNEECASWRLGAEICDGLRVRGCVGRGEVVYSQCGR